MGIPPEIAERIERGIKLYYGVRELLRLLKEQRREFEEALEQGATEVVLPTSVENEGLTRFVCCDQMEMYCIYLNFEHTIWACPECRKVYAFRIEQPEDEEDVS